MVSTPRPLSSQVTFVVIFLVAVCMAVLAAFFWLAITKVDEESLQRQIRYVASGIDGQFERLPREQQSSTVWDDAIIALRMDDQQWMVENLGLWMGTYFGHDAVFVLAPDGSVTHAMESDETVPAAEFEEHRAMLAPMVAELRIKMALLSGGLVDTTAALADAYVTDVIDIHGVPAIASVRPILPSSDAVTQAPGTEWLHLSVQFIDATTLGAIGDQYELADLRLVPDTLGHGVSIPLRGKDGAVHGYLTWEPSRPGLQMAKDTLPAILVGACAGIALVGWLLRRLMRSSVSLQASEAQAQFLAFHDTLTGLPNRGLFEDRLERALSRARVHDGVVGLLYLDLDRFKTINDTLGHGAGDELVRQVSSRLLATVGGDDTVARLGGDEFAVILDDMGSVAAAENMAERLIAAIAVPFDLDGEPAFVTASIGIVTSRGDSADSRDLLRKADIALYEAKNAGRGRYELFAGDMDEVIRRRRHIEHDLREAIDGGDQLHVVYQPLYAPDGRKVIGAEALVRWNHPVHGQLPPDLFIGIAEERGLIDALGEFVLEEACTLAVETGLPWVAVNVSPVQFRSGALALKIMSVLARTGLAPSRLQIEITEGLLLENGPVADATLRQLREAGVRVALDDFGTGYSSMNYLRRYGIDKLKIDRSFISQLGTSTDADAIVRAMVALARSMNIRVTAEGVETEEQRDHLEGIGCDELQGFLMSRPLSVEDLSALLTRGKPLLRRVS